MLRFFVLAGMPTDVAANHTKDSVGLLAVT
jgi:hypothetical protein